MTRIFDEQFEATGYDETGWTEVVGSGSTVDEDADSTDVSSPTAWGSKCCKIIVNDNGTYSYNSVGAEAITYWRVELVITAEGIANSASEVLFCFFDNVFGTQPVNILLAKSAGGVLQFYGAVLNDGSVNYYLSNVTPVIDTKYRFEIKWDATNNLWAWKIDGVAQLNDQDSTYPITSEGLLTSTHGPNIGVVLLGTTSWNSEGYTCYYDLVACDDADWVGSPIKLNKIAAPSLEEVGSIAFGNIGKINGVII